MQKYNHQDVERGKEEFWRKAKLFQANLDSEKNPYTIVIPPPNVTGNLHLGHAWNVTLQDIMIRYKKLNNYDVLWVPGSDHAGIATQAKVVEKLKKQGQNFRDLTRAEFLEVAYSWKDEYAKNIHRQWAKLGLGLDYSREKFTLDDQFAKLVNQTFVEMYENGLIYKGKRPINWDVEAQTALSNIEVIHKTVNGKMYYLKYEIENSSNYLTIATTRPETIFADSAIVVHPEDERYHHLKNQQAIIPGTNKKIPILTDDYVDQDFGTGAMKVTPYHDVNDFEIGKRHNLEMLSTMNLDGTMNELALEYVGMDRMACRDALIENLKKANLVIKVEDHEMNVGFSERTNTVVEQVVSDQWFVKMKDLAKQSIELQKTEQKIKFYNPRFEKTFLNWMENIEDWCISRQLWWGHQIPAWTHNETHELYVGVKPPSDLKNWTREEDVLDTWFSSALWPLGCLNYNENEQFFQRYFPTDLLVTGYDIIFFWVSRMIFQSLRMTSEKPFKDVLIHGLIRDQNGQKMSKSLGNGIDPMDLIDQYGADNLRWYLATASSPGQDILFDIKRVEGATHFTNKIWNAANLINSYDLTINELNEKLLTFEDYWLYEKHANLINLIHEQIKNYEFGIIGKELYKYIWDDFCNNYIETSKYYINQNSDVGEHKKYLLKKYFNEILIMMHPFMPFVTEELYMQNHNNSILTAQFPKINKSLIDDEKANQFEVMNQIIYEVRNLRAKYQISQKNVLTLNIATQKQLNINFLNKYLNLAIDKVSQDIETTKENLIQVFTGGKLIFIKNELIDETLAQQNLLEQKAKLIAEIERSSKMVENPNFVERANPDKVLAEREKLKKYQKQLADLLKEIGE